MTGKIFYGWWMVGACLMSMLIAGGSMFFALPVFLKPLAEAFGWSRAQVAGGISAAFVSVAVAAPLVGAATGRYGPRTVMLPATVLGGLSLVLLYFLTQMWEFYGLRLLMGLAYASLVFVPVNVTVSKWFVKKRGQAIGMALIGMPLGGLIFTPLTALMIETVGWQTAFVLLGLSLWAILLPIHFLVLRNNPSDLGLLPDGALPGESGRDSAATVDEGVSWREALRTVSFWLLVAINLVLNASLIAMLVHQFAYLTDLGYGLATAGIVVSTVLAISVAGGLFFGWASDRLDARYLGAACFALGAGGVALLMLPESVWLLFGYVALFGLSFGGSPPLLAVVTVRTFGPKAFGAIYGSYETVVCAGALIGPTALGRVYDAWLSYQWGFAMVVGGYLLSAILILCVRPARTGSLPQPA